MYTHMHVCKHTRTFDFIETETATDALCSDVPDEGILDINESSLVGVLVVSDPSSGSVVTDKLVTSVLCADTLGADAGDTAVC